MINDNGEESRFATGDVGFFPAGTSCTWYVPSAATPQHGVSGGLDVRMRTRGVRRMLALRVRLLARDLAAPNHERALKDVFNNADDKPLDV